MDQLLNEITKIQSIGGRIQRAISRDKLNGFNSELFR